MNNKRKQYTPEFKQGAIELIKSGRAIASVARELGVTTTTLRHWIDRDTKSNTDEYIRIKALEAEVKALKREAADKDETIDILKKAAAIFTR